MGRELSRSSLGRLSEFSRWNKGRYKRSKRDSNLNKSDSVGCKARGSSEEVLGIVRVLSVYCA